MLKNLQESRNAMVYSPVTRLFTVLDLLQTRSGITAAQLAEHLEVNTRSVRRYITMLQDLGIPVESERGPYGGYRLRPGFKLPPLMWTEEEALAITLGLRAAQQLGLADTLPGVVSALAKVERVLPLSLRERVQAVQDTVTLDLATPPALTMSEYVMTLSTAAQRGQRVWIHYQARAAEKTERALDCYGLLYRDGQWYAIGYCHLRQALRTFRLDRILLIEPRTEHFVRPHDFDCLAYALQAFAAIPSRWLAEVLLKTTLEQVRCAVPAEFATLEETQDGILLRAYDDDLDHMARFLVNLGCPFLVLQPQELLEALQQLAENISHMVAGL
jgi:predicted DNA-binding transcriptional regulator YafY